MTTSKAVLITGATRGLGNNLAHQFARRGYRLALTGRSREDLDRLAAELAASAAEVVVEVLDVTAFDTIGPVMQACARQLGGLDIVVVNAGVAFTTPAGKGHFDRSISHPPGHGISFRTSIFLNFESGIFQRKCRGCST